MTDRSQLLTSKQMASFVTNGFLRFDQIVPDELNQAAMRAAAGREEMMAAGLAVALAREGMPFRRAHALVGQMVAEAARAGGTLREAAARVLPTHSPAVAARLAELLDPGQAVRAKAVRGGTAPEAVRASLEAALRRSRE